MKRDKVVLFLLKNISQRVRREFIQVLTKIKHFVKVKQQKDLIVDRYVIKT